MKINELKSCPFCGGNADISCDKLPEVLMTNVWNAVARCGSCGALVADIADNESEAIQNVSDAWNTRHERTCVMIPDEDYDFVTCSHCGYEEERNLLYPAEGLQIFDGNYCPNCGAKVISNERH